MVKLILQEKHVSERRITIVFKEELQKKDFKLTKHGDMLINEENCRFHYPFFCKKNVLPRETKSEKEKEKENLQKNVDMLMINNSTMSPDPQCKDGRTACGLTPSGSG